MIEWGKCKPEDFEIDVQGDEVNESGICLIFPVKIYHKNGDLAFSHGVSIRSDFFNQLKHKKGYQEDLMVIIQKRIRDEISRKIKSNDISIDDKLGFMKMKRQSL